MTALDFPNSPTLGQTYTASDRTWVYNGYGWDLVVETSGGGSVSLSAESPITYNSLTSTVGLDEEALIVDGGTA